MIQEERRPRPINHASCEPVKAVFSPKTNFYHGRLLCGFSDGDRWRRSTSEIKASRGQFLHLHVAMTAREETPKLCGSNPPRFLLCSRIDSKTDSLFFTEDDGRSPVTMPPAALVMRSIPPASAPTVRKVPLVVLLLWNRWALFRAE